MPSLRTAGVRLVLVWWSPGSRLVVAWWLLGARLVVAWWLPGGHRSVILRRSGALRFAPCALS